MSLFENSPPKWPNSHSQKLFLSLFEKWQNSILSRCSAITSTPVAELVLVLSDPVFSREQCSPGSAQMGWRPRFLWLLHTLRRYLAIALTYWLNFYILWVRTHDLVKDNKLILLKVTNVNIKQFCYILQTLVSIEQF